MAKIAEAGVVALPMAAGLEPIDPDLVDFITEDIVANAVRMHCRTERSILNWNQVSALG